MLIRLLVITIMIILLTTVSLFAGSLQGSNIRLGENSTYKQVLHLQEESTYEISLQIKGDVPEAIVTLAVFAKDEKGNQLGFAQVYRGIGDSEKRQQLGIEFDTPQNTTYAELVLSSDLPGEFNWTSLVINKVDSSPDKIRKIWEEKFEVYDNVYTGLVIDARGLNLKRGMSPRIWSESEQLIYGGVAASLEHIQNTGVVFYGRELTPSLLQRIQVDPSYPLAVPLVLEAVKVGDVTHTSVIISDDDANKILQALAAYDFLGRFKVIFLID